MILLNSILSDSYNKYRHKFMIFFVENTLIIFILLIVATHSFIRCFHLLSTQLLTFLLPLIQRIPLVRILKQPPHHQ